MIFRPTLPPKRGYVEVEVDGIRQYRNAETGILLRDEKTVEAKHEPTQLDIIEAQIAYTAMMTDTLLTEV